MKGRKFMKTTLIAADVAAVTATGATADSFTMQHA